MKIYETVVMRIGKTQNGHVLRTKMAESILSKFDGIPIVLNKDQSFKDYNDEKGYRELPRIGRVVGNARVCGKKVLADIEIDDEHSRLWRGQPDNWCMSCDVNADKEIVVNSIISLEVF